MWSNRFKGDTGEDCLVSVDGTDFMVAAKGFGTELYSYKFKRSGLRYEVALCIKTGDIVWINGPYEPGLWNDLKIFRHSLVTFLEDGERVEADDGYLGEHPRHVKCPGGFCNPPETEFMQKRVRNRHETVNKRFKQFEALKQRWRHNLGHHGNVLRMAAVLTQVSFSEGEPLFQCGYRDPPY